MLRLAQLIGIPAKRGWQAKIGEKLGFHRANISSWVQRDNIPEENLILINDAGFPLVRWYYTEWADIARHTPRTPRDTAAIAERLQSLLHDLGLNRHQLYSLANINPVQADDFYIIGDKPNPRHIEKIAQATNYRRDWLWYGRGRRKGPPPYTQPEEEMVPPKTGGELLPGSYGQPDLSGHRVTRIIGSDKQSYLQKAKAVLESDEIATIQALCANIDQFYEKIQEKKKSESDLARLEERINQLEGKLKKNPGLSGAAIAV